MADYRLTRRADDDVSGIYEYTIAKFGLRQARNYLNGLYQRHRLQTHVKITAHIVTPAPEPGSIPDTGHLRSR